MSGSVLSTWFAITCMVLLCAARVHAAQGWLKVVASGDYLSGNPNYKAHVGDPQAGWHYDYGQLGNTNLYNYAERASVGVMGRDAYSVSDDFSVPSGKTTQRVMLALQGVRSFNQQTLLNPLFIIIGIIHHNETTDAPDHWRPAVKWFKFTAPVGGWHNMSRDVPGANTNPTSTGIIPDFYDWFELDVSDVNSNTGLGEGHYWFSIQANVRDHSTWDAATNSYTIGNNFAVGMSFGAVNFANGAIIQGKNPGFGSGAKLPYVGTDAIAFTQDYNFADPAFVPKLLWKRTPTCAYDTAAACDLSMLVFLWTDVTTSDTNVTTVPLPPPTCRRNSVPYVYANGQTLYLPPNYNCPGTYYDLTDPAPMAANPSPTPGASGSTPTSAAVANTPNTPSDATPAPTSSSIVPSATATASVTALPVFMLGILCFIM